MIVPALLRIRSPAAAFIRADAAKEIKPLYVALVAELFVNAPAFVETPAPLNLIASLAVSE